MQTWLDWEADWLIGRIIARTGQGASATMSERMRLLRATAWMAGEQGVVQSTVRQVTGRGMECPPDLLDVYLLPLMAPFLGSGPGCPAQLTDGTGITGFLTTSIRPTADLVDALADARVPAGTETAFLDALREGGMWYIDLPHRALMVGSVQVRALFVGTAETADGQSRAYAHAVLTRPSSNDPVGRALWTWGDRRGMIGWRDDPGLDMSIVAEQAEALVHLLVLYRATADRAQRAEVPCIDAAALDRNLRRLPQNRKKTSLFRVETLASPPDRFGRAKAPGAGGWKLGSPAWRSSVTGHFKMQAHGPKSALRKLIYVAGYERGPVDGPRKATLEILG